MIGGQYDVYPYFVPLAVAQFAQDTHRRASSAASTSATGSAGRCSTACRTSSTYFRDIAVAEQRPCATLDTCTYDPRAQLSDTRRTTSSSGRTSARWIWAYIPDRNQYVAVQKERNTASYVIVRNYTDDVVYQHDDGAFPGGAYGAQLPMKYFLDSFNAVQLIDASLPGERGRLKAGGGAQKRSAPWFFFVA